MAEPSKAVFLSYASQDAEAARRICDVLRAAGIEVWFDQSELRGGDAWDQEIRRQIRDCALFVPIISSNTQARLEGYFRREWKLAAARTHDMADEKPFLVPVVIDETTDQGASVPELFRAVQWTRLPSGETPPAFAERIARLCAPDLPGNLKLRPASISPPSLPPVLPDKPSIAVLPFRDLTGGAGGDFFADGMVDEITTALSRFSSLFVIANSSTLAYRGEARNLRQIARDLGVRYLLEGDVRQAGEQVRISVKLTDAVDNLPFWNQRFDGIKEDVFALQEKVANMIAAQIEPHIEAAETRRISAHPAADPKAYELYLRALHAFRRFGEASNSEALGMLEQALALDPTLGPALELASQAHTFRCINGWTDDVEATRRLGQEFARRALHHGPGDPRVLIAAAMAAVFLSNDLDMAATLVEQALVINPNSSTHLMLRGWIKLLRGDAAPALEEMEAALRLNPQLGLGSFALLTLGYCHLGLKRFAEAIKLFREAAHRRQESEILKFGVAVTLAHLGQMAEAKRAHGEIKPQLVPYYLTLFHGPTQQEILRTGLELIQAG
jgi:TolB-like protein